MTNDQKPAITLAQWCAYLPYGITVQIEGTSYKLVSDNSYGASLNDVIRYNAKSLLRPMNDDVNVSAVMQRYRSAYGCKDLLWNSDSRVFTSHTEGSQYPISCAPYDVIQAFLAAHYDIFNLIPQGLALPIE